MPESLHCLRAAERVVLFLEKCGNADIEAGIGQVFGIGSPRIVQEFMAGLIKAIEEPPPERGYVTTTPAGAVYGQSGGGGRE